MLVEPRAKALVLDANILVRAVLGRRVLSLLEGYAGRVDFLTPEMAFTEAGVHLLEILAAKGLPPETVTGLLREVLTRLTALVVSVPHQAYAGQEAVARRRLVGRDASDWHFVALALALGCPIWTEDRDFFGTGVPTWTTDRVEIYLASDF